MLEGNMERINLDELFVRLKKEVLTNIADEAVKKDAVEAFIYALAKS